jgi:phosphatidylglycerol:prolipoprotein diacylglycerol transferase
MIPYLTSTTYPVFGIPFQTWGTFVALGFLLGTYIAWRRAKQKGLKEQHVIDLAFWIFVAAMIGSRVFHVLFYDLGHYLQYPLDAINPMKPGYAIFGGFIGAFIAFFLFVKKHGLDFIAYADTLIWGLPWGCGVGRIGCFLIHDHPGTVSDFVLAVKYPDGKSRHDLGLYLALIGFAVGFLFLWLNRKEREPGFWFGVFMLAEAISRFGLDFLRVVDMRYLGLTPTQWLSIPLFLLGVYFVREQFSKAKIS